MTTEGPFVCYRELLASSNICSAVFFECKVFESSRLYLASCTTSTLSIYWIKHRNSGDVTLILTTQHTLFGRFESIKAIPSVQSGSQSLLATFDKGKFVILNFDTSTYTITEYSQYNAEESALGLGANIHATSCGIIAHYEPISDVDILSGLAANAVYYNQILFIPTEKSNENLSLCKTTPFVIDLRMQLLLPGTILDICFVSGYASPTLAVLQESDPLPIGHAKQVLHTCILTLLSIDTSRKVCNILWQKRCLPHDSLRLIKLTDTYLLGTVGIVSMNAILFANQHTITAIAMNGFVSTTVHSSIKVLACTEGLSYGLELDASRWVEGSDLTYIGCLKGGELVMVQMKLPSTLSLSAAQFEVEVIAKISPSCSCFVASPSRDLWFIGSRQSDGYLMQVQIEQTALVLVENGVSNRESTSAAVITSPAPTASARKARKSRFSTGADTAPTYVLPPPVVKTQEMSDEELLLYGEVLPVVEPVPGACRGGRKLTVKVVDSVSSLGPVLDGLFTTAEQEPSFDSVPLDWSSLKKQAQNGAHSTPSSHSPSVASASAVPDRESKDGLLLSTGLETDGALTRLSQGIRLSKMTGKDLPGALATFTLDEHTNDITHTLFILSSTDRTRVFATQAEASHASVSFIELNPLTLVLISTETTVNIARLTNITSKLFIQVTLHRIRILKLPETLPISGIEAGVSVEEGEALQDMILGDDEELGGLGGGVGETIVQADFIDEYVLVLTSFKTVYVLRYVEADESLVVDHVARPSSSAGSQELQASEVQGLGQYISVNTMSARFYRGPFCLPETPTAAAASLSPSLTATVTSPEPTSQTLKEPIKVVDNKSADTSQQIEQAMRAEEIFLYGQPLEVEPVQATASTDTTSAAAAAAAAAAAIATETTAAGPETTAVESAPEEPVAEQEAPKASKASKKRKAPAAKSRKTKKKVIEEPQPDADSDNGDDAGDIPPSSDPMVPPVASLVTPSPVPEPTIEAPLIEQPIDTSTETDIHIIFADALGTITLVNLNHLSRSWSSNISGGDSVCTFDYRNTADAISIPTEKAPGEHTPSKLLCDVRLASVPLTNDYENELSALCLIGIFDTGDVLVYHNPYPQTAGSTFVKVEHSVITHRFRHKHTKFKVSHNVSHNHTAGSGMGERDGDKIVRFDTPTTPRSFGHNYDPSFTFTNLINYRLESIADLAQSSGVLIPGPRPVAVLNYKGRPTVLPLCLPELPYTNPGLYRVSALTVDGLTVLVMLWQESAGDSMAVRRTLGLYYQPSEAILYTNSILTASKCEVSSTVHFLAEMLNLTDDKKEQALLQKKTYIMACSDTVQKPFSPSVLTDEEKKLEEENYDRFFTDLTSFCQPDETIAPSPLLDTSQYKLVLAQRGVAVDEYALKEREQVLGMEVLYLTTEQLIDPILTIQQILAVPFIKPPPVLTPIRRVFVAISTYFEDKHGEDTQGEGRLLMFSLDYKLFEQNLTTTITNTTTGDEHAMVENKDLPNTTTTTSLLSLPLALSTHNNLLPNVVTATAQTQFLQSIRPKLRLHWSGPGPASTVRQMGQYVISTVGYSVFIYKLNKETLELDQVSFHYAKFYISNITIIKNYIILSDVCNSLQFLVWREADLSLTLLSKDYDTHIFLKSAYLVDGQKMGIIMTDTESNLQMLQFNPRYVYVYT